MININVQDTLVILHALLTHELTLVKEIGRANGEVQKLLIDKILELRGIHARLSAGLEKEVEQLEKTIKEKK